MDWLEPGYYKMRLRSRGPWVPIEIWLEDGDRDPETWELLSDQKLRAQWWPNTASDRAYNVDPRYFFNRARPISKEEFEWLRVMKTIR